MKFLACLCLVIVSAAPGFGKSHHPRRSTGATPYDSYLLTLSWSPEYCSTHPTDQQCTGSKHFGFVVHGLWPEYKGSRGPENCNSNPGLTNPSQMLDIMPSLLLIQHEWTTHGTCTGLSADDYFALIRKAFKSVKLPVQFPATESPSDVKKAFESLNSNLTDNELMVTCPSNYLQGVEICLTKGLAVMACTAPKECRAQSINIPPVR